MGIWIGGRKNCGGKGDWWFRFLPLPRNLGLGFSYIYLIRGVRENEIERGKDLGQS